MSLMDMRKRASMTLAQKRASIVLGRKRLSMAGKYMDYLPLL